MDWLGDRAVRWIELALATPVVLWSGWTSLVRGSGRVEARLAPVRGVR